MRLLLFGSFVVLLGVVGLAAVEWTAFRDADSAEPRSPMAPVVRFVKGDGEHAGSTPQRVVVWQTSTALTNCAELIARRRRGEKQRIADLMSSEPLSPSSERGSECALFELGQVDTGTKVELLDGYGDVTKVRILSGKLRGREGFVQRGQLEAPASRARS
jgi:hypothetical protein